MSGPRGFPLLLLFRENLFQIVGHLADGNFDERHRVASRAIT